MFCDRILTQTDQSMKRQPDPQCAFQPFADDLIEIGILRICHIITIIYSYLYTLYHIFFLYNICIFCLRIRTLKSINIK